MVVGITAFCGLVIALVLSAILKAFDIASSPPRTVWQPVNVRHRYANLDEPEDPHHPATSASYAAGALFGRKPWQEKLPGEAKWIRYLRGFATLIILVVIAIYGAYQAILKPIAEMGMVPSNEFRGLYLDGTTFSATNEVVYNLVVAWKSREGALKTFMDVAVVDLFPQMEGSFNTCSKSRRNSDFMARLTGNEYEVVIFRCGATDP
ncbi:hypothetical protein FA13DRAFT_1807155 [Coprinellus micaceus]|uniref:Uncharacterized protein n=1 Tax=Coprinellus micaceus TaxID=71717 RepID=A0A4Y7RBG4_COPMI|nr:hypothetical protein FA13DRAFT_1807155 [Coprinellus micaceus]